MEIMRPMMGKERHFLRSEKKSTVLRSARQRANRGNKYIHFLSQTVLHIVSTEVRQR